MKAESAWIAGSIQDSLPQEIAIPGDPDSTWLVPEDRPLMAGAGRAASLEALGLPCLNAIR